MSIDIIGTMSVDNSLVDTRHCACCCPFAWLRFHCSQKSLAFYAPSYFVVFFSGFQCIVVSRHRCNRIIVTLNMDYDDDDNDHDDSTAAAGCVKATARNVENVNEELQLFITERLLHDCNVIPACGFLLLFIFWLQST